MEKLYSASTQMTPMIYKEFYKTYYSEKLRTFKVIASIIAIILLFAAAYIWQKGFGIMWAAIAAWIGVFLLFYPHVAYRKPYKQSRDNKQTTHFAFYETYMTEKTKTASDTYNYSDLKNVLETSRYLFIFHSEDSVSIVEKDSVKDNKGEALANFLKTKTECKKV